MLTGDALWKRGQEIYNTRIREAVETEENIGKLISINVDDETFIVNDDRDARPLMAFRQANPDASILILRIGYNVAYTFGGLMERTA